MRNASRSKKAFINMYMGFADEIVTLICSLILPRLILTTFGSEYNGLTSSITQFISVIALMKAGIGGVTRAALYKPLAEHDTYAISAIMRQTEKFMRKIAFLFVGFILIFACIYPTLINHDFDFLFSFSLILIISMSTFAQYYFGLSAQMLLYADQRQYIPLIFDIAKTIANTVVAVIIINLGFGIHAVKLGSAAVFVITPILLNVYAKRRYKIVKHAESDHDLITQRWDAVGHEVANFINSNTDIMVLTIFTSLGVVSVYTVYHYVIVSIRKVLANFVTGFGAAFGNMYARKEYKAMDENLRIFELIVFSLSSVIYSVAGVMLTPFVMVYTTGVKGADYFQPVFGIILTLAGAFSCYRIPYQTITTAVGHYKQTRNGAFAEAGINIVVSIACVVQFGLVGVAVGTLAAAIFRTIQYAIYLGKNIIKRNLLLCIKHILIALAIGVVTYIIGLSYTGSIKTVFDWIIYAVITTLIAVALTVVTDFVFYFGDTKRFLGKIKNTFMRRRKSQNG